MNQTDLRDRFLGGMSFAAATVNVVTTDGPAGREGVTVSAMSSVSADTPRPTLLVCVHHESATAAAILANGVFCVNVLQEEQSHISDTFAGRHRDRYADKFDVADWTAQSTGAPRVIDPLVAFDCAVVSSEKVGTHHVFIGEVQDIFLAPAGSPLVYAKRAYGRTHPIESAPAPRPPTPDKPMTHHRIRPFNTAETYPEQNLSNDLSHAVVTRGGRTVWMRGQCPQDLTTFEDINSPDPAEQTHKVMQNIKALVEEAGGTIDHVVKLVVYITDVRNREAVYRTMGAYIKGVHPVSTGLVVNALARPGWLVEIDATAVIPDDYVPQDGGGA